MARVGGKSKTDLQIALEKVQNLKGVTHYLIMDTEGKRSGA